MKSKREINLDNKKVIPLYVTEDMWKKLKLLALKKQSNMNELCREGIELIIKKYNSLL